MKYILLAVFAMPLVSFAQSRPILEARVQESLKAARLSITANIQKMSSSDLQQVNRLLKEVSAVSQGQQRPGPMPMPNPVPAPRPRPQVSCSEDRTGKFQSTFVYIKEFAYSSEGLNYSSTAATSYATQWTNRYPCSLAETFAFDFKRLKNFAYSSEGLNLSSSGAIAYAQANINNMCPDVNFEAIFKRSYDFAYSSEGLNMSSSAAVAYAKPIMEEKALRCDNGY